MLCPARTLTLYPSFWPTSHSFWGPAKISAVWLGSHTMQHSGARRLLPGTGSGWRWTRLSTLSVLRVWHAQESSASSVSAYPTPPVIVLWWQAQTRRSLETKDVGGSYSPSSPSPSLPGANPARGRKRFAGAGMQAAAKCHSADTDTIAECAGVPTQALTAAIVPSCPGRARTCCCCDRLTPPLAWAPPCRRLLPR